MFGLRSVGGRAVLAGVALVLVLAAVVSLATWRDGQYHERLLAAEDTSVTLRALERARAEFLREQMVISILRVSDDPTLLDVYQEAAAEREHHLSQARAELLAKGEADHVADLDDLAERIGQFTEGKALSIPILLEAASETAVEMAPTATPEGWPEAAAITADFNKLIHEEQTELAAQRAAVERAGDLTFWLVIGFSAAAFVVAAATVVGVIVSVVRPLAALRTSARAITSGDPEARAKVSGPDEVASLARDFNEMTDTLSAKTEALRESEERFRDVVENAAAWIWEVDANGKYTYANPVVEKIIGYKPEEVLKKHFYDLFHPEDREELKKAAFEVFAQKQSFREFINRNIHKNGKIVWLSTSGVPILDEQGNLLAYRGADTDITERKRAEETLRESERRYRLLAENTSDLIWTMDLGLRYTYMSPSVEHMRGYSAEEIVGTTVAETMTPASLDAARKTLAEELALERMEQKDLQRSRTLELEMYCKDGSTIWTEMKMTFLRDPDGQPVGILGVTRDISERKRAEEERETLHAELELRAITDSLTGLYDHAHFYQRLAEEIDRSKRYNHGFALVMLDVDDFKRFNDSRGHQAGDEMLRLVARCIRSGLRSSDLAFRYGGDEFAAILPHADAAKARAAVNRMNGRITKRLKQMDGEAATRLSLSAGVACFPDDGTTTDDLVRIADAALYSAKWVARARDIMGQREDIQSLASALVSRSTGVEDAAGGAIFRPEALHEQQARIVSSVASSIAVALKDAGVAQALEDPDLQVLATVGAAAEIKDRHIRGHPERVSEQAVALAEKMGLSPKRVRDIRIAGLLHDIGKVTVSEGILNKPGKLTRREFASIRDHPIVGATLVSQVRGFERLVPIVRHHHERFDGKGYPDGLAGEDIPPEARILSVVDVFDAMTHERSYRKAASREETIAELERGAGTQFDAAVVKAFLALVKRRGKELAAPAQAASGSALRPQPNQPPVSPTPGG